MSFDFDKISSVFYFSVYPRSSTRSTAALRQSNQSSHTDSGRLRFNLAERVSASPINIKLVVTLVLFVVSFVISCGPLLISWVSCAHSTVQFCKSGTVKRDFSNYTLLFLLAHTLIIPILYGFRVAEVQKRFIFCWKSNFNFGSPHGVSA